MTCACGCGAALPPGRSVYATTACNRRVQQRLRRAKLEGRRQDWTEPEPVELGPWPGPCKVRIAPLLAGGSFTWEIRTPGFWEDLCQALLDGELGPVRVLAIARLRGEVAA